MATIAPQQIHYAKNSHKEIKPSTASPDQLLAHISNNVSVIVECPREARCHAERRLPKLSNFIHQVYTKCCLTPTLLVVALIYLRRLQRRLRSGSQGGNDIISMNRSRKKRAHHHRNIRIRHALQVVFSIRDLGVQVFGRLEFGCSQNLQVCCPGLQSTRLDHHGKKLSRCHQGKV